MTTLMSDSAVKDEAERQTYVDQDGYVVDVATGEVLGIAGAVDHFQPGTQAYQWRIDSEDTAEWVLERRSKLEADIAGLEAREAAIVGNIRAQIAEKRRRLAYLDFRFRPSLIEWARNRLAGGKKKTLQLTHGRIAFRMGRESHRIIDMEAAVQWAKDWDAISAIKVVESIGVRDVQNIREMIVESMGVAEPTPWMVTEPAEESVRIETGIHTKGDKE